MVKQVTQNASVGPGSIDGASGAACPNSPYWCAAETEEELAELLDMFWMFHDFRVEEIRYSAAEDRIDLQLEYDSNDYRVLLRFVGGAYMNFRSGLCYPADWLQGASLGLTGQGRALWAAADGIDPTDPPENVLWISGCALRYAMLGKDGNPMAIPKNMVHQEHRAYDYRLRKTREYVRDFHPRYLCDGGEGV